MIFWEFGFMWQSDFTGEEVGFPDVEIVGIYTTTGLDGIEYTFMIDVVNHKILSIYKDEEEE